MCDRLDVLVVEDDIELQQAYCDTFFLAGFTVEACTTLAQGRKAVTSCRPRVVWLNPGSEDADEDWQATVRWVADQEAPAMEIVVVTGDPDSAIPEFCEAQGVRFVWKQFTDPERDVALVAELLRGQSQGEPNDEPQ